MSTNQPNKFKINDIKITITPKDKIIVGNTKA